MRAILVSRLAACSHRLFYSRASVLLAREDEDPGSYQQADSDEVQCSAAVRL
jgi:hypothetical protein